MADAATNDLLEQFRELSRLRPPITAEEVEAERRAEEARRLRDAERALEAAGFPPRHIDRLSRGDYDRDGLLADETLRRWAQGGWRDHWCLVAAPAGSGKTFMATAIARRLASRGYGVGYRTYSALLDEERLPRPALLVVDDWARDRWHDTPSRQERAREVVDYYYRSRSSLLILSDRPLEDLRHAYAESVRAQVIGRLRERCGGYVVVAKLNDRR